MALPSLSQATSPRWLIGSLIAVLILCALLMLFVDRPVMLWIHGECPAEVKAWFKQITDIGKANGFLLPSALVFLLARAAMLLARGREGLYRQWRYVSYAALFVFAAVLVSGLAVTLLKITLARYRPYHLLTDGEYGFHFFSVKSSLNSFPSGHSQVIWSAMTAFTLLVPRVAVAALPVAVLLSGSRVFVKYHFISDVLMGSFLGIMVTLLIYRWFRSRGWLSPPEAVGLPESSAQVPEGLERPASEEACRSLSG